MSERNIFTAAFRPVLAARRFDEDTAHGLGGGGEEVPPAVPSLAVAGADQPKVGLMNQGSGLEGVVGRLAGHARGGELAQLLVHEREQVGGGLAVAARRGIQKTAHVGHSAKYTRCGRREHWNPGAELPSDRYGRRQQLPRYSLNSPLS